MYTIRLENTITHQIYEQQVQDNNNGEKLYFRFGVSTFDLVDGEYILTLLNAEGDVLAEDLMRIGDYNPEALQYSKGENTYIDVTLNAVLQAEKYVTITEIQTRIVPDLGNDAIETVYVDAQPLYDSARSEGYDEGYSVGQSEGYPNGYADGYDSGRTDGYAEGYDVGSMDMHLEMLEETRILNVTENGRYFTKYTEDPYTPTGDGDFSDFCKLTNATYQMGRLKSYYEVQETGDDVIEFWWKPKDLAYNHRPQLLMSSLDEGFTGISHSFSINLLTYDREDKLRFSSMASGWTSVEYIISSDPEMWYHILLEDNGVYVNDEYVGKFYIVNDNETSYVYVNGDTRNDVEDGIDECNGYFGMVKINGEVFIPTENGYMNQNTGDIIQPIEGGEYEYLKQRDPEGGLYRTVNVNIDTKQFFLNGYDEATQKIMDGVQDITITENGQYGDGETLYKTIDVNITPIIKFAEYGMKCSYSSFKTLPSWVDLNGMADYSFMFTDSKIEEAPYIDTSKAGNMKRMYANCYYITSVPLYDVKNATDLTGMFSNAQTLQYIPNFELGTNVTIAEFAYGCKQITKFPQLDTSGVVNMQSMVYGCTALTELPALDASNINVSVYNSASLIGYTELKNLTKAGGLIGLRRKIDDNYGWSKCPNLDYESCINILNGLFDFAGNGITPSSNEGKLKVHKNFLDLVGDEIIIGTNKGWTITV